MSNWYITPSNDDILHYGVLGMKWGVRRYQNANGSLTSEGRKRYLKGTTASRTLGNVVGTALGGPIAGYLLGKKAEAQQVKSNIEKEERRQEAEAVSQMSDTELRDFNYRKSLERQLGDILSSEHEKTGIDYVKDLLGIVGGGANIVQNVANSAVTLSTPSKKDKDTEIANIKARGEERIKVINERKEALIKAARDEKSAGRMSGSNLNNAIDKIKNDAKAEETAQRNRIKAEIKDFNNRSSMLVTTRNRAGAVSQLTNMSSGMISNLAKAYNSGSTIDTSGLSNQQLQKLVDRARMEQQYLNIVTPANTRNGIQYVGDVVNMASQATGVGSQLIGIHKTLTQR